MSLFYLLTLPDRCPICRRKFTEHSEFQDKICKIITIKEFAAYCPGFDVQYRPSFELDWKISSQSSLIASSLGKETKVSVLTTSPPGSQSFIASFGSFPSKIQTESYLPRVQYVPITLTSGGRFCIIFLPTSTTSLAFFLNLINVMKIIGISMLLQLLKIIQREVFQLNFSLYRLL